MQDLLLEATEPWGVTVERVEVCIYLYFGWGHDHCDAGVDVILVVIMNQVKDVRVPAQLMRAMAAEAEAAREARAKVVLFMTIRVPKKSD